MLDHPNSNLSDAELEDISAISASGLFDGGWYYDTHSDVAVAELDALVHYVKYGAAEGRNPSPFFDTRRYCALKGAEIPSFRNPFAHFILSGLDDGASNRGMMSSFSIRLLQKALGRLSALSIFSKQGYINLNQDISSVNILPAVHALLYGFAEGRKVFSEAAVSKELGRLSRLSLGNHQPSDATDTRSLPEAIGVYYNSQGNGFIREIAADLVSSMVASGVNASLLDEHANIDDRPPVSVIVGPHEFFHLGRGSDWAQDSVIKTAFMFNTEQPQTIWFERGMPFVLMSLGVLDICSQVSEMFAEAGIPALHVNPEIQASSDWLLPGDMEHPLIRVLPKQARAIPRPEIPLSRRPIDISFFGGTSAHREGFFTRNAAFLADYECYLYYRRFEGPHTNSKRDGILSRLGRFVAAHSKISLNIHRDDYGFFEWHRIVKLAMAGGSVVVSEPCLPHPLFKPGIHYFEECGRHMPDLIDWLLKSEDGKARAEEVRANALALINDQSVIERNHDMLRLFIGRHSGII
jgi:hypothetical protein